ncbi:MAG TPA: hypothetical protein VFZ00_31540 [Solirubrobacter sp.]|jgi:hypothetical protein|nr:hypothetical protein [Solirubrobacter sp.]
MTEHEKQADELQERSDRLGEEISEVRENWEAMRRDESVPGAPAPESGLPPEANYTTSGAEPPEDDDAGDE